MTGLKTQLFHAPPQFICHFVGASCRRHRRRPEVVFITTYQPRNPVVVRAGQDRSQGPNVARGNCNVGREENLSVDFFKSLVFQPALQVPTARLPFGVFAAAPILVGIAHISVIKNRHRFCRPRINVVPEVRLLVLPVANSDGRELRVRSLKLVYFVEKVLFT